MIIYIKNKLMSFGGSSTVKDEQGKEILKVKGKLKLFSPTRKKRICDLQGNTLYMVRNKFWKFFTKTIYIYEQGQKVAQLKSKQTWGKKTFVIEGYNDDIVIQGRSYFDEGLSIIRNGEKIGSIKKNFTIIRDSFILEAEEADLPFLVAIVIALDNFADDFAN